MGTSIGGFAASKTIAPELGDPPALASTLPQRLQKFPSPLLVRLDEALDWRLARTFAALIAILLQQRHHSL